MECKRKWKLLIIGEYIGSHTTAAISAEAAAVQVNISHRYSATLAIPAHYGVGI